MREFAPRKLLADDNNCWRIHSILHIEIPSARQRDAKCLKVSRCNDVVITNNVWISSRLRFNANAGSPLSAEGPCNRQARGSNTGDAPNPPGELVVKHPALSLGKASAADIDWHSQDSVSVKARIDGLSFQEGFDEKAGRDQDNHREGNFTGHEQYAKARAPRSALTSILQHWLKFHA